MSVSLFHVDPSRTRLHHRLRPGAMIDRLVGGQALRIDGGRFSENDAEGAAWAALRCPIVRWFGGFVGCQNKGQHDNAMGSFIGDTIKHSSCSIICTDSDRAEKGRPTKGSSNERSTFRKVDLPLVSPSF